MTRLSEKYNDSCVKMFEFLKLLSKDKADYKTVLDLFSDETTEGKSNPHVALNKYLNTLKIFGIKVKKEKGKYYLLSSPYKIDLDANDLKIINLLKESIEILPNGKNKNNFEQFIKALEIRYSENTQTTAKAINTTESLDFSFCFTEFKEQIKQCEKYCQDNQKLEITYKDAKGKESHITCAPIELKYIKRKVWLRVNVQNGSKIIEIPLDNIKSINQLPSAANKQMTPTTIVYKIKNRLIKNYKMRDWERSDGYDTDSSLIIINKNEDYDVLLKRLMRYGSECVIVSPRFIRELMLDMINKTLENYKD